MAKPQTIHTEAGEELVVLSRRDYDALLARAGDAAAETAMTARIVAETGAAIARGEDVALPAAVWEAIEAGESPIRAVRRHRGLTQEQLAAAAGISQGYLAQLESGAKSGSPDSLRAIARALAVTIDVLVDA